MKKTVAILLALACLLLAGVALLLAKTVPVYPDFQKEIDTYKKAQRIVENRFGVALPDGGSLQLTEARYTLQLDGRTVFSEPTGFYVFGRFPFVEGDVFYSLHVEPIGSELETNPEEPLHISKSGNINAGTMTAVFRQNGWCCTMTGTYPRSGSEEVQAQIERELQDVLIGHYRLLFDQLC